MVSASFWVAWVIKLDRVKSCNQVDFRFCLTWSLSLKELRDLHWLPVRERIEFKLAVLVFRCLANELCRVADIDARRRLRCASTSALVTPSSRRSTIGDRAFFVAAPRVWNSLPIAIQRHRHSAPSGAGWRHIFSLDPLPNSTVLNLHCAVFL